jgi:hypothetical protein
MAAPPVFPRSGEGSTPPGPPEWAPGRRVARGQGVDGRTVAELLDGFKAKDHWISEYMRQRYTTVTKGDLLMIARGCIFQAKWLGHALPPDFENSLSRSWKRRKDLLFKWFVDHWPYVMPVIPFVQLADPQRNTIGRSSANARPPARRPVKPPDPCSSSCPVSLISEKRS